MPDLHVIAIPVVGAPHVETPAQSDLDRARSPVACALESSPGKSATAKVGDVALSPNIACRVAPPLVSLGREIGSTKLPLIPGIVKPYLCPTVISVDPCGQEQVVRRDLSRSKPTAHLHVLGPGSRIDKN